MNPAFEFPPPFGRPTIIPTPPIRTNITEEINPRRLEEEAQRVNLISEKDYKLAYFYLNVINTFEGSSSNGD